MNLKNKIFNAVKNDFAEIESALKDNLNPHFDFVLKVASHILFSGGKRLRPLLMILSARICGYNGDADKYFSTIFEYLHVATLLHDDVVDGAAMRRGKTVSNAVWGSSATVLTGDFLLARSLAIAAETGKPDIIKLIAQITEYMSQGEIEQLIKKGDLCFSENEYMNVIRYKTAILFQGACCTGSLISDAPYEYEKALSEYGCNLGIGFQMADDLLDYTSNTKTLGKEPGADIKEGKITLPVIYSLKNASSKERVLMEKIIKDTNFSDDKFETFVGILKKTGGLEYTNRLAGQHIEKAKKALLVFKDSETKETMLDIADYALQRSC